MASRGGDGTIRVLHVDDEPDFGDVARTVLEREDERIETVTAESAAAGLEVLDSEPIDCVVSDYEMPGRDGIEFLEAVRESHGDLPFILFTGRGSEEVASDAIAAGVTDYVPKGRGTDQYALLANRVRNAVAARRSRARATRQERINDLIREINRQLVAAETTGEIDRAVCRTIADSEQYRFAWLGDPDPDTGEIVPRASAGDAESYLDEVTIYHDSRPRGDGPGGRAVRTGAIQVTQDIPNDESFEPWRDIADRYGYESVVVLPLRRTGDLHSVLAIYAAMPNAFDEAERTVLAELADTVGDALDAAETRRRLALRREDERSARMRHYRMLAEMLPNGGVALFDTDYRYTLVGGAVFDDLDISAADLEGKRFEEVHSASFREAHREDYRAALDGERRSFEFEYGGRVFRAHVGPVRNEVGDVVGGVALTQDVTERHDRRRELERRERILREVHEVIADTDRSVTDRIRSLLRIGADALGAEYGILSRVEDGEYTFELVHAAEGAERTIRAPDDAAAEPIEEGDTVPLETANCERVVRTEEAVVAADVVEDDDLAERPPHETFGLSCYVGAPVVVDGEVYGTCCFYDERPRTDGFHEWDATLVDLLCRWMSSALDRQQDTQRLREHNERLEEFASIVSHDLRNPLQVLKGSVELAEETGDPEQFARCHRAIDRMDDLIADLLALARGDATDVEPVDLASLAERYWNTADTDGGRLRVETETTVRGDEGQLRRLFENLFRNSVEHGSTDDRTESDVTVTVGDLPDGFYVEDTGVGIPPAERDRVFQQGYSTGDGGAGLGLRIVKRVAENHGWAVSVTEGSAGGARFEFTDDDA